MVGRLIFLRFRVMPRPRAADEGAVVIILAESHRAVVAAREAWKTRPSSSGRRGRPLGLGIIEPRPDDNGKSNDSTLLTPAVFDTGVP